MIEEADISDVDKWEKYFVWLKENAELFQKVFPKYIKKAI